MKYKYIYIALFFVTILIIALWGIQQEEKIQDNFVISKGRIYEMGKSYKSGNRIFFKFRFEVNATVYSGNMGIPCDRSKKSFLKDMMVNREMPVVYENGNPGNCEMLLIKSDFDKYKVKISKEYVNIVDSIETICRQDD